MVPSGQIMNRYLILAAIVTLMAASITLAAGSKPQEKTGETIAYLLDFVAKSDYTFIRNGHSYAGKQASAHMKRKYEYFKDKIKTPEDFIRLAATKSLQTDQPYKVKSKEGKESRCDEWMKKVLSEYRKANKDKKCEKEDR